jgi:hypothetical protein
MDVQGRSQKRKLALENTDSLTEGVGNLYYTEERVNQNEFVTDVRTRTTALESAAGGGGGVDSNGSSQLFDFRNSNTSQYKSAIDGTMSGVENVLYHGQYLLCKAAVEMSAGRVCSFFTSSNDSGDITVTFCDSDSGEENESSQCLGITLNDVAPGGAVKVAISGICSVLSARSTNVERGALVTVRGRAALEKGRCVISTRGSDEASCGICLSADAVVENAPIVVWITPGFESF